MKLKISDDLLSLLAAVLAVIAAAASYFLPGTAVSYAFGIILIFFLPGYALTRVFFKEKLRFDMFVFTSIGLSVMIAMIVALILALTPIRLTQESSVFSLLSVTLVGLMTDRLIHHENRRFEVEFARPKKGDVDPIVASALAFAVVLIVVFAFLFATTPAPSTTHVIMLSEDHDTNLPANATFNEKLNFSVEIKNGEGKGAEFRGEIYFNDTQTSSFADTLTDQETESYDLNVTAYLIGHHKVEVKIYIDDVYYGEVHFWVNVS